MPTGSEPEIMKRNSPSLPSAGLAASRVVRLTPLEGTSNIIF